MALDADSVRSRMSTQGVNMSKVERAATFANKDPKATKEEVQEEAIGIVLDMIDALPLVARWLINDKWAARFAEVIAGFLGDKVTDWFG